MLILHRWAGLFDGRHAREKLVELVNSDESLQEAKQRIKLTDVLIIDEVSMLSSKLFLDIDYLFRKIRSSELTFGGIQTILVGDFYQLPPVPNVYYSDYGEFVFRSDIFKSGFPHRVTLSTVFRQEEPVLIQVFFIFFHLK